MPDLRQLRVFVTVAEERNFTRAARRLYLGQQAVSKTVGQLERELGVELLERTTHHVRLTPAGAALLEQGRHVLAAADDAFLHARRVGAGLTGTVTVGATPAIAPAERDRVVRILRDRADRPEVSVRDVRPREIRQRLDDRDLDLALARTGVAGLTEVPMPPTPAVVAVPTGHPLAAAGSVGPARLDGARLLTWNPPGTPFTDLLVDLLAAAGATVTPVPSRVTGGVLGAELTDADAVALLPTGWPPGDGVTQLRLDDEIPLPLLALTRADAGSPLPAVRTGGPPGS